MNETNSRTIWVLIEPKGQDQKRLLLDAKGKKEKDDIAPAPDHRLDTWIFITKLRVHPAIQSDHCCDIFSSALSYTRSAACPSPSGVGLHPFLREIPGLRSVSLTL
jgi:hypothetical protein